MTVAILDRFCYWELSPILLAKKMLLGSIHTTYILVLLHVIYSSSNIRLVTISPYKL